MRLEDVSAELRPRGPWESVDLGFAMTRRHFPHLLAAWGLTVVPLWLVLLATTHWVPLWLVLLVIWWMKPIYDRVPLFILSRSLFGDTPKLRDVLRAWPGMIFRRFVPLMLLRVPWVIVSPAFSWARSFLLPLVDLEGQKGRGFKERQKVLLQSAGGTTAALMVLCGVYEVFLVFGLLTLGGQMIANPAGAFQLGEAFMDTAFRHGQMPAWLVWSLIAGYLCSMTLVELFYVGAGFGLYINCRTLLEGWDVEIAFRRLARRLAQTAVAIVAICCLPATGAADDESADAIKQVLAHEDFKVHTVETWQAVPEGDYKGPRESGLLAKFGNLLFYTVIIAAVALIAWLVWKNRHIFQRTPSATAKAKTPRTVMGMDVSPDSLPADIIAAARLRWQEGDARGALSLLYRGSLVWLIHSARLPVRESDTEGDCVRHARALPEASPRNYFEALTCGWVLVAYAGRVPAGEEIEHLLTAWPFAGKDGAS